MTVPSYATLLLGTDNGDFVTGKNGLPAGPRAHGHGDHIVFMYAVHDGPASQSYGLQVAALAGVPRTVIERATSA